MPFSITKTRANVGTKFAESVRLSRSSVQRRSLANHRSSSSSSPATSSSQILQRNENLAPIQLQEFARKQFEKKTLEKSRKVRLRTFFFVRVGVVRSFVYALFDLFSICLFIASSFADDESSSHTFF